MNDSRNVNIFFKLLNSEFVFYSYVLAAFSSFT